jgi:hypothetical protein
MEFNNIINKCNFILNDVIDKYEYIEEPTFKLNNNIIKLTVSRFYPKDLKNEIMTKFNKVKKFTFKYKKNIIHLYYVYYINIDNNLMFSMMEKALAYCNYFKENSKLDLYFIPHEHQKNMDNRTIIDHNNVNSGFTAWMRSGYNYITIFRKEECEKVLLHELTHYLEIDFCKHEDVFDELNDKFVNDYAVDTSYNNINVFEAYTDFTAIMFNYIFNSIIKNQNLEKSIANEIKYQKYIIHKLMNKFSIKHPLNKLNNGNKINQNTNVASYYVLKYALTKNYKSMLNKYKPGDKWNRFKILEFYDDIKSYLYTETFSPMKNYTDLSLKMSLS